MLEISYFTSSVFSYFTEFNELATFWPADSGVVGDVRRFGELHHDAIFHRTLRDSLLQFVEQKVWALGFGGVQAAIVPPCLACKQDACMDGN